MKKLLVVLMLSIVVIVLFPIPAFASDPPTDVNVDIGITTGGDANVDIGINAGGDANVSINGGSLATNEQVNQAITGITSRGAINYEDWWRYYYKFIAPQLQWIYYSSQNSTQNLDRDLDIAILAISRLITSSNLTDHQITYINQQIRVLSIQQDNFNIDSKSRDGEIQNQLSDTEASLKLLQGTVDEQNKTIIFMQDKLLSYIRANYVLETASQATHDRIVELEKQYSISLWIISGCMVILLGLSVWSLVRKH